MKLKAICSIILFFCSIILTQAQFNGKMKIYFNNPVNTTVSTGINAVYLNNSMDDTLAQYINRAKYTLDIAVYNYQQSSSGMADIATAINNAQTRGVIVRWIYDGSQSNSGMSALNSNVHILSSPTTSNYGIMHNKFMIIDANSSDINDPLVWTGSTNWTKTHFNSNVNNTVIIQDKDLAQAYLAEFNEMWGTAGTTPDSSNSKFGPYKTDPLTTHIFTIDGKTIELYFSPTDGINSHVLSTINSADTDLYFGMLTFSLSDDADSVISNKNNGVYVAGIIDQSSQIYAPYSMLNSALGTNFEVYSQLLSVYHNKILIVDPSNASSDPTVITGSYNWTTSADTQNDENALIIHDSTVANIFYQSFYQNFSDLGGTLSVVTQQDKLNFGDNSVIVFPTINNGNFTIKWQQTTAADVAIAIYDLLGHKVITLLNDKRQVGINTYSCKNLNLKSGVYLVKIEIGNADVILKIVKLYSEK